MSQFIRPDQGSGVGRGQRFEIEAKAETDERERRLPRANYHRGADSQRRDGRLVQSGEKNGQERGVRRYPAAHQRRNQGRGKGGALSRAVHLPARESLPQPVRGERRHGDVASGKGRRRLEGLFRSSRRGARRRVRHALRHREHLPGDDVSVDDMKIAMKIYHSLTPRNFFKYTNPIMLLYENSFSALNSNQVNNF